MFLGICQSIIHAWTFFVNIATTQTPATNGPTDDTDTDTESDEEWDGRIGERMQQAVRLVGRRTYQSKNELATTVGPHGSTKYGYEIVNRCMRRFFEQEPDHPAAEPRGFGAIVLNDNGKAYLEYLKSQDDR